MPIPFKKKSKVSEEFIPSVYWIHYEHGAYKLDGDLMHVYSYTDRIIVPKGFIPDYVCIWNTEFLIKIEKLKKEDEYSRVYKVHTHFPVLHQLKE